MDAIGLRELRQNASQLIRQVQAGETVTVTVSGRAAAQLVPVGRSRWRTWAEVAPIFDHAGAAADDQWEDERELIDQAPTDPWNLT